MRKSESDNNELFESVLSENEETFEEEHFRRTEGNPDAKRSIEDYFERKRLNSLDDWYKDL